MQVVLTYRDIYYKTVFHECGARTRLRNFSWKRNTLLVYSLFAKECQRDKVHVNCPCGHQCTD